MARKRKARTAEAPQPIEPEPQPDPEPELELEQPVQEEINETVEEEEEELDPGVEVEEEVIEDEEVEEVEEEEEEEEEENPNEDLNEHQSDAVAENNEPEADTTEKPSESAGVSTNGVEQSEKQNDEKEEDLEEEPLEKVLEPFTKDQLGLLIKESVAKHPDLIESVHKLADADPAHRKIFVHGLGWEASSETITSVFGKYGEIEDCKVVKDKISGKSKGYGFILFKHRGGARRALKQPQKLIEGRMTSCQLASAGPVQEPPPTTVVASVSTPPTSEYTQRKIFVSNVSAELDPNKLLEYFSQFGEIEEGPLGLDKQTGKPRGFCLFVYKSVESAKKALEDPHKNYEGQTLHCQKAVDGPKHGKGGHFQHHGGQQQHQHHHQGHQGGYHHPAKKGRYSGGAGHTGGHLMAPSGGSPMPSMGFNPGVAPAAIGQAVAALLASQGGGLGIGNLFGGMGAGVNQQGAPQMMNNAGYGGQSGAGGYGGQPGVPGGYGGQQQMGQPGVRPHQGGAPYMGHGR